jgi:ATP-dependent RNA helicase RhlE
LTGLEYLVLDEADRMLDMGFLPDIRRVLRHLPPRRQTLFFSATMPAPIAALASEMLKNPVTISLQRQAAPAVGITQAVYPVPQELKPKLFLELLERNLVREALVFTRTKHRANRLAEYLVSHRVNAARIPRQPIAGAAVGGAGRLQERQIPCARRHRHRRARN